MQRVTTSRHAPPRKIVPQNKTERKSSGRAVQSTSFQQRGAKNATEACPTVAYNTALFWPLTVLVATRRSCYCCTTDVVVAYRNAICSRSKHIGGLSKSAHSAPTTAVCHYRHHCGGIRTAATTTRTTCTSNMTLETLCRHPRVRPKGSSSAIFRASAFLRRRCRRPHGKMQGSGTFRAPPQQ